MSNTENSLPVEPALPVSVRVEEVRSDQDRVKVGSPHPIEERRALFAYCLFGLLAVTIVGHYGCVVFFVFTGKVNSPELLDKAFSTSLPIVSGLVGTAAGYYFARSRSES